MLTQKRLFKPNGSGFSLIEMAIVLLIVSTMLGGLLMSLSTTREISSRNSTEATLDEIAEALYGFAQASGRLPCPATAGSNGLEAPAGGGNCTRANGFVPSATLGLKGPLNNDNLLMDSWLSAYRYSVSTALGNAYTSTNFGGRTVGELVNGADLQVCDEPACTNLLANDLPAVVLSLGADWASFSSTDEVENSGELLVSGYRMNNDNIFVSTGYIEDSFDDILNWVSPSILISRLIAAGRLP
ncbi:MAG: prepilin-type N-terminal cleavage/methylation domain-containing protein [Pseudohongiellaceae bacterium]|jgi:prepilin-type N-terminal cleavage/methylation domain-containing protein